MVLLTITPAIQAALADYLKRPKNGDEGENEELLERLTKLSLAATGSPMEHHELIRVSRHLVQTSEDRIAKEWRLDTLLHGVTLYQPSRPPKPQPVCPCPSLLSFSWMIMSWGPGGT